MKRMLVGAASIVLLIVAGVFIWKGQAEAETAVPAAPSETPVLASMPQPSRRLAPPPQASEKSKEEKRFARADQDQDGRITLAELYQPRRKAFARLDRNGDGALAFEEWAESTNDKFAKADGDRSGWLSPREYERTRPKQKAKPRTACAC